MSRNSAEHGAFSHEEGGESALELLGAEKTASRPFRVVSKAFSWLTKPC